jgi:N-acetylglucosaminyl-diphospho-decaprenol L-rhamnosyltransferase
VIVYGMSNVTAILIAYNSEKVIGPAIASLQADPAIAKIIVVDNRSQDKTRAMIRREFPKVLLVENPNNDGYGRGANLGLAKVETLYALFVNPDAVMSPGAVEALLETAKRHPDAALIAPALYGDDGRLQHSFKRDVFEREVRRPKNLPADGELCAEFVSGAVVMFNMALMCKVGFYDPKIFLYYEDDDICLRVRRAGYSTVYVPQARAMHLMGASSGKPRPESEIFRQKHMTWSRLYIEEKYRGKDEALALAEQLQKIYARKLMLYRLQFNRMKVARYKGRLQGIAMFTAPAQMRQAA